MLKFNYQIIISNPNTTFVRYTNDIQCAKKSTGFGFVHLFKIFNEMTRTMNHRTI